MRRNHFRLWFFYLSLSDRLNLSGRVIVLGWYYIFRNRFALFLNDRLRDLRNGGLSGGLCIGLGGSGGSCWSLHLLGLSISELLSLGFSNLLLVR